MTYKIFKIYNTNTQEVLLINSTKSKYTSKTINNYFVNAKNNPSTPFLKELLELGKENVSYKELEEINTNEKINVKPILDSFIQDLKPKYSSNQNLISSTDNVDINELSDTVSSNNVEPSLEPTENHHDDLDNMIENEDREMDNMVLRKELESKENIIKDLMNLLDIITEGKPELKKVCMAYIKK